MSRPVGIGRPLTTEGSFQDMKYVPLIPERFGSCFSMKEMYDGRSTAHARGIMIDGSGGSIGFVKVGLTRRQIISRIGVMNDECILCVFGERYILCRSSHIYPRKHECEQPV